MSDIQKCAVPNCCGWIIPDDTSGSGTMDAGLCCLCGRVPEEWAPTPLPYSHHPPRMGNSLDDVGRSRDAARKREASMTFVARSRP